MKNPIQRLREYFDRVGKGLRGEASIASIFPNSSDVGNTREEIYKQFLIQHSPSKCNIFKGGFVFDSHGIESKQIDLIVTTDTCPQFNALNQDGSGKSFAHIDGTVAIASIKSSLDKKELLDSLENIKSVPIQSPINGAVNPALQITNYEDWPYKIIYASNGLECSTIIEHLNKYFLENPTDYGRKPNLIHVAGKYVIIKGYDGMHLTDKATGASTPMEKGRYYDFLENPDINAMINTVREIQERTQITNHIIFKYHELFNNIGKL